MPSAIYLKRIQVCELYFRKVQVSSSYHDICRLKREGNVNPLNVRSLTPNATLSIRLHCPAYLTDPKPSREYSGVKATRGKAALLQESRKRSVDGASRREAKSRKFYEIGGKAIQPWAAGCVTFVGASTALQLPHFITLPDDLTCRVYSKISKFESAQWYQTSAED